MWLGVSAAVTAVGIVSGLTDDVWGWWWISVGSAVIGLWLIRRDPASRYRAWANRLLVAIGVVLAVLAVAAVAFVIWFSSFEF